MKCSNCGCDITSDMYESGFCFNCGTPIIVTEEKNKAQELKYKDEQERIKKQELQDRISNHMLTTGMTFEGYTIKKYLGLVSGDTVMCVRDITQLNAIKAVLFSKEAKEYSKDLKTARKKSILDMVAASVEKGGNAIIGITLQIYNLNLNINLIGVSVNGTSVVIEKDNRL